MQGRYFYSRRSTRGIEGTLTSKYPITIGRLLILIIAITHQDDKIQGMGFLVEVPGYLYE